MPWRVCTPSTLFTETLRWYGSSSTHSGHALISIQQNILVDAVGHTRIAGLGAASMPSSLLTVDVDRGFYGAAPELIDPQRFGLVGTESTKASDVYAFGIIAWEVSRARSNSSGEIPHSMESFPGICRENPILR